jgi:hypothetical protein
LEAIRRKWVGCFGGGRAAKAVLVSRRRSGWLVALALFAAVFHGLPVVAPLLAVLKRQPAGSANFGWKLAFFEGSSHKKRRKIQRQQTFAAQSGAVYV